VDQQSVPSDQGVPASYENGEDIRDRAFGFACGVVKLCERLYDAGGVGRMMVPQLVNCSTSFAGMLEEARAAESKRDFISKCCIGLKECREARTRLRVCYACGLGPPQQVEELVREARELTSIVGAIIRNTRRNAGIDAPKTCRARILKATS
jgi:four helix bundle protein